MKKFILSFAALLVMTPALAQPPMVDPNKRDEDLTKSEAEVRITEWTNRTNALQTELDGLNGETSTLNTQLTQMMNDVRKCNEDLYALLGATEASVNDFRNRLGAVESRVREIHGMSDDQLPPLVAETQGLESRLNNLRREKLSLLPEFYNKIIDVASRIQDIYRRARGNNSTYTVGTWAKDRDCLWNISGKEQIYNDPLMWPKIYLANTDKISNPDLIYPGQVLNIPPAGPKSDEELRAERLYYRKKRMASRRAAAERQQPVEQEEAGSGN
jgi:hypothetical protein